ncbi:heme-binding protein [Mesorhizobium sp. CA14]|uniref:GlcG/HbpS family heme-binding protein n=1 Tax=unclassified Mesorhizobium TaxID=325217 RepID=UPI00112690A6|nr:MULTISPECIES: heme-binding protein [unclassified Mesorhizobium]MBZ9931026.1 heme-binding protein [Mesorhizobium sp. BR1-1-5]MBZ9735740.1 heme-binding protein [Mesorhizobium sp. CA9]MBZ9766579.1 heme-binding protein [Mesorhizobium sp. CA6]MBZ9817365.1 heme-binding protein [Mesorhizobium sp. CA7]MBZ9827659.1 heme-binding protein [Mesorhizobium sp. CA18]
MDLLMTAKKLAERVEAEAIKAKIPVAVCIVDVHGNLVLQHRMNGAPLFSLEISERKAYTSALVRMRTIDLLTLVQPGQSLYVLPSVGGGRFCPMGGGVPLTEKGEVYAGIGVSGGTAEEDVAIVEAALQERAQVAA